MSKFILRKDINSRNRVTIPYLMERDKESSMTGPTQVSPQSAQMLTKECCEECCVLCVVCGVVCALLVCKNRTREQSLIISA